MNQFIIFHRLMLKNTFKAQYSLIWIIDNKITTTKKIQSDFPPSFPWSWFPATRTHQSFFFLACTIFARFHFCIEMLLERLFGDKESGCSSTGRQLDHWIWTHVHTKQELSWFDLCLIAFINITPYIITWPPKGLVLANIWLWSEVKS